jgi:hypothetical protein
MDMRTLSNIVVHPKTMLSLSKDFLNMVKGGDVVVQGSLYTTNIGDQIIGEVIKNECAKQGLAAYMNGTIGNIEYINFKRYNYHIIAGGGVIRDYPPGYLKSRLMPIGTSKCGSAGLGLGFNGLWGADGKTLIKKLNNCKVITVRDSISKKNLEEFVDIEVYHRACPSFLATPDRECIKVKEGAIGINLRGENFPGGYLYYPKEVRLDSWMRWYRNYLDNILKPYLAEEAERMNLVFIPFTKEDICFARREFSNIPMDILPLQSARKTLGTINDVEKMICMRYHSIVFATLAKKPRFVISYQDKTLQLSKEIGIKNYVDFTEEKFKSPTFSFNSNQVEKQCKNMRNSAKENFNLLWDSFGLQ